MDEPSALNSVKRSELVVDFVNSIKEEIDMMTVKVKPEPQECVMCVSRSAHCVDPGATRTLSGTLLTDFLSKYTQSDLFMAGTKYVCKSCHNLVNILERAELEYLKLKEEFEAIISKNPLFHKHTDQNAAPIKLELEVCHNRPNINSDSEDEPLAVTRKKRRTNAVAKKKASKTYPPSKRAKPRAKQKQAVGIERAKPEVFMTTEVSLLRDVKKEDSMDSSETSLTRNGLHSELKLEIDEFAEQSVEDDDDYFPDDNEDDKNDSIVKRPKKRVLRGPRQNKKEYKCDQCDAKYTSFKRFEMHQQKHAGGKPPYICEVCGASYKHKRACDIHIQLHRGISDWKCEECNKLFPSKGALQRHNNIHTGKLNYQCDLCGKSFIHTSSFKMHKLSHSGVKPHTCDICGLALMTRSHLKRHKRVHSGEKRHECTICGKRFSERYNLVAHSKAHETAGEAPPPAAPRRRLFRCAFCTERYERRYMLERHVSLAHNRTLERLPPTPRNTMSKLLKAQAQARAQPPPAATPHADLTVTKEEAQSPESTGSSLLAQKLLASSPATWSGAYVAELGLRDYTH